MLELGKIRLFLAAGIIAGLGMTGCENGEDEARSIGRAAPDVPEERTPGAGAQAAPGAPAEEPPQEKPADGEAPPQEETKEEEEVLYFPTGEKGSSPLRVAKKIPETIRVGAPFSVTLTVTNQYDRPISHLVLHERLPEGFQPRGETEGLEMRNGTAVWAVGMLPPGESKSVSFEGWVEKAGPVRFCTEVDARPELCVERAAVAADLELSVRAPADVLVCDPLPATLVVRNTGKAALKDLRIEASLPDGLKTQDGKSDLAMPLDPIEPGRSRELKVPLQAERPGSYKATFRARSAATSGEAAFEATVREPALELSLKPPSQAFLGRPATTEITVRNPSDAPSHETVVRAEFPEGIRIAEASDGGESGGNAVVWNLGTLDAGASRTLRVTYTTSEARPVESAVTAKGHCAKEVGKRATVAFQGAAAVRLEVVDAEDPIPKDGEVTYRIAVTNQGSAPQTGVRLQATLDEAMEFGRVDGPTSARPEGKNLRFEPLPTLAPGDRAVWTVTVRPAKAGEARFQVELSSDQLAEPVREEEPTRFLP